MSLRIQDPILQEIFCKKTCCLCQSFIACIKRCIIVELIYKNKPDRMKKLDITQKENDTFGCNHSKIAKQLSRGKFYDIDIRQACILFIKVFSFS